MSEVKNIPRLRFPEFDENWFSSTVGKCFQIIGGGTPSTTNIEFWGGDVNWFTPTEIKKRTVSSSLRKISRKGLQNSSAKILPINTVLFTSRATIGEMSFATEECSTNQGFQSILPSIENDNRYFYYWAALNKKIFFRKSTGSTFLEISKKTLEKIQMSIPSLPEQQKIADFLTSVDKRIELLEKKKTLLETYKKGVMKKIFNQEIRFKDDNGSDFPDWEEYILSELGDTLSGLTGKTKENFDKGSSKYIQYKQVFGDSKIDPNGFGLVDVGENEKQTKIKFGDILFTTSSETPNEIGMSSVFMSEIEDVYLNSFCFGFRPKSLEILIPSFSRFLFRNNEARSSIVKLAQGSTRYNMSKINFLKIRLKIPSNGEQIKISQFLSSIDTQLVLLETQIDKSKTWKKGLLQKMFV